MPGTWGRYSVAFSLNLGDDSSRPFYANVKEVKEHWVLKCSLRQNFWLESSAKSKGTRAEVYYSIVAPDGGVLVPQDGPQLFLFDQSGKGESITWSLLRNTA